MLDKNIDLLPYIAWEGDRSKKDLVKEQLVEARKALNSSSIINKTRLIVELDKLCQNVSFRSAGQEKFDLLNDLIRHLQNDHQHDQAQQLKSNMKKGSTWSHVFIFCARKTSTKTFFQLELLEEMKHAAAEDKIALDTFIESFTSESESEEESSCSTEKSAVYQTQIMSR